MGTEGFSPFANRRQKLIPKMQERLIRKIGSVRMRVRGPIGGPQRFDRSTDQVFVDLKKAERIRLLLYSQDLKLQPVLAPALGREFQVTVEPNPDRVRTLIAGGLCDVLVLDL